MKTIVWDIDDVLNDCMKTWLESFWLPAHPDCSLTYNTIIENPPYRILGVKKEEYLDSLDKFRVSPLAQTMIPDSKLLNWFKKDGWQFRHIALTARPRKTVSSAIVWMLQHFSEWFQTFSFIPAERCGELSGHPDREKSDFLLWLNKVDYFIDDNPENVMAANKIGIKAFLVARPWNNGGLPMEDILETGLVE